MKDLLLCFLVAAPLTATTYYLDCSEGRDARTGASPEQAWRELAKVNATRFAPGDSILLRRGSACEGMLAPQGSGAPGAPIRIGAYGEGPLPVIRAGGNPAGVRLFNQEFWEIENLEVQGGNPYGIHIGGDRKGVLRHFRVRNVVVRDVTGDVKSKASGLVAVLADHPELALQDILIDGVTAHHTTQWAGIIVRGGSRGVRARNVTVRNSVVHDVYGDGIVLFQVENGLVEKCAAWLTGLQPVESIGTPNGIWTWRCRKCTVEWTEGFWIDSPGADGGVYDIDWGNDDNVVQYNFGHDAMGYCASVFGAQGEVTTNSVIRYNVCVNNGRSPKLARRQGDLYISTWEKGSLDGVLIHNNTFYWNPPIDAPLVQMDHADFTGRRPNVFHSNLIYSLVPSMVHSSEALRFDRNLYWHAGPSRPRWHYGGRVHEGFDTFRTRAGQEPQGVFADPRLTARMQLLPGSPAIDQGGDAQAPIDAFATLVPQGKGPDVGAAEYRVPPAAAPEGQLRVPELAGKWFLLSHLDAEDSDSRSQVVFLQAALAQYREKGLEVAVVFERDGGNTRYDWDLGAIRVLQGIPSSDNRRPVTLLVSPEGRIARRWEGFAAPADLGLSLRSLLGPPAGSPSVDLPR